MSIKLNDLNPENILNLKACPGYSVIVLPFYHDVLKRYSEEVKQDLLRADKTLSQIKRLKKIYLECKSELELIDKVVRYESQEDIPYYQDQEFMSTLNIETVQL